MTEEKSDKEISLDFLNEDLKLFYQLVQELENKPKGKL